MILCKQNRDKRNKQIYIISYSLTIINIFYRTISTLSIEPQFLVTDESTSSRYLSTIVNVPMMSPDSESSMENDSNTIFRPPFAKRHPVKTPTPNSAHAKKRKVDAQSFTLQSAILNVLKMPIPEIDAVDGFLKTLREVLRRLPYEKRARLQIKLLTMAVNEETE